MSAAAPSTYDSMLAAVWDYRHPRTGEVVVNVEALCRRHLNRLAARLPRRLEPADYDNALAHLLGQVVVLAETRYDPVKATSLGDFLNARLAFALIDFWRESYGTNGEKRVVDAGTGDQALRDAGADDFDWTPAEPTDERLEASVEDYVLGRLELLELVHQKVDAELAIRPGRRQQRRPPAARALA